jgi:pyruvate kinase
VVSHTPFCNTWSSGFLPAHIDGVRNSLRVARFWSLLALNSIELCRDACASKQKLRAVLLDTKGPEIRTAMLRDGKNITLQEGQDIILEAVGDKYTEFEGYKTDKETRIGISYAKLCTSVAPGNRILIADGNLSIEVVEILSATELKGKVLNSKELGQRKNCNLPGLHVDLPVLGAKVRTS